MDTKNYGPEYIRDLFKETPTTRKLLQQALEALELSYPRFGIATQKHVEVIAAIRAHLAKPEPAWLTDIVGYGQFIDGKLVACSQSEMRIAIGSKNVECRPLYSVTESAPTLRIPSLLG